MKTVIDDSDNNDETKSLVMKQAEEILQSVQNKFPSFIKVMLYSYVTKGFWMVSTKLFLLKLYII